MARAKAKQTEIPGTERKGVPELEELAAPYAEALYDRMELQQQEKAMRSQLLARMVHMGHTDYVYTDGTYTYEFHVKPSSKLETKRRRVGDGGDGEEVVPEPEELLD